MPTLGQTVAAGPSRAVDRQDLLRTSAQRHRHISEVLARDVIAKLIAPDVEVHAAQDMQIKPIMSGQDLQSLEVSVRLKVTPEDLASQMLVRLDEALGLESLMQQQGRAWFSWECNALADVAITVAERIQGSAGDAGELNAEVAQAVSASNQGAHGVACYLIERLGVGEAFDVLAQFARTHLTECNRSVDAPIESGG